MWLIYFVEFLVYCISCGTLFYFSNVEALSSELTGVLFAFLLVSLICRIIFAYHSKIHQLQTISESNLNQIFDELKYNSNTKKELTQKLQNYRSSVFLSTQDEIFHSLEDLSVELEQKLTSDIQHSDFVRLLLISISNQAEIICQNSFDSDFNTLIQDCVADAINKFQYQLFYTIEQKRDEEGQQILRLELSESDIKTFTNIIYNQLSNHIRENLPQKFSRTFESYIKYDISNKLNPQIQQIVKNNIIPVIVKNINLSGKNAQRDIKSNDIKKLDTYISEILKAIKNQSDIYFHETRKNRTLTSIRREFLNLFSLPIKEKFHQISGVILSLSLMSVFLWLTFVLCQPIQGEKENNQTNQSGFIPPKN